MMKPSVVLKNRNLTNQRNNRNFRFFLDQSINQKQPLQSLLSSTQSFLTEKMNKPDDQNMKSTINNFESNKSPENFVKEKSENFKNRKKRTIDDDEYEIPPNTYNVCM